MEIKFVLFERTLEMITPPIAFPHKKKKSFTYQTNRNISRTKSDMEKLYMEFLSRVLSNKTNLIFISYTH